MADNSGLSTERRVRASARFVGRSINKIDAKGRVSVPADLRRYIDQADGILSPVVYCFPSLTGEDIQCGGEDLTEQLLDVVSSSDVFSDRRMVLERVVLSETERLYFDDNGRITLTKTLRDHARLETHVAFLGLGSTFSMMAVETAENLRNEGRGGVVGDERAILGGRSLPSSLARKDRR